VKREIEERGRLDMRNLGEGTEAKRRTVGLRRERGKKGRQERIGFLVFFSRHFKNGK